MNLSATLENFAVSFAVCPVETRRNRINLMPSIKTIVLSKSAHAPRQGFTERSNPKANRSCGGFVPGGIVFTAKLFSALRIISLTSIMSACFSAEVQAAVEIKYSAGVSEKHRQLLSVDLARIGTIRFSDSTGEVRRILKLPDMNGPSLEAWLQQRAQYIIDEKHPLNGLTLFALAAMEYPAAPVEGPSSFSTPTRKNFSGVDGVLQVSSQEGSGGGGSPSTQSSAEPPNEQSEEQVEESGPTIVMGNIGAALYMAGRANKILVGFSMMGQGLVPIQSPRVGLFQVGRGMFMPLSSRWAPEVIEDFVHSMFRIDTLFHEARHSDGNVRGGPQQLGFAHEVCPDGHEFAGFPACDLPSNGPYRIGSLILKAAIEGCGPNCTTRDTEILTLLYADSMSRILTAPAQSARLADDDLCTKLLKTRSHIPFCAAPEPSQMFATLEWDETPEGVELLQPQMPAFTEPAAPAKPETAPTDMTFGE